MPESSVIRPAFKYMGDRSITAIQRVEVRLKHAGRRQLALAALALFAVAVALIIFARASDSANPDTSNPPATVSPTAFVLERISHGRNGNIFAIAAGRPLFPLPPGDLRGFEGAPVEMQDVPVFSVVAENGMWVGESEDQRVFVTLAESARGANVLPSAYKAGDRLNLSGRFVPIAGFERMGVSAEEGSEQLFKQTMMVEAVSFRPPTGRPDYED